MKNTALRDRALSSVSRIMMSSRGKQALPRDLAECTAELVASDIVKTGEATLASGRLYISPETRRNLLWLARNLAWMANPDHHHGQQAAALAKKTLRALQSNRFSVEQLWEQAAEFGRARKKHIARNSAERPRAKARSLNLGQWKARWLTSEAEIDATGHQMGNCLANKTYGDQYKAGLRNGEVELVVLEEVGDEPEALLSASGGSLDQVKGPRNRRPIRCRDAIIDVLVATPGLTVGECSDLLEMGICDQLVRGRSEGTSKRFRIAGRTYEVGAGFLAMTSSDYSVLLRWDDLQWDFSETIHSDDDGANLARSSAGVWVREACRRCPELARACAETFQGAPRMSCLDWFGSPRRAPR